MESECQFVMPPQPRLYDDGEFLRQLAAETAGGAAGGRGGGGGERKRRFTEEQVRSLETTFHERRAKLEPREKAELARELGLQPRQVAIWFQNKRARWRTKQIEHDFAALRAQYDALLARVDSLKHEKLALAAQLDELRGRLNERHDVSGSSCDGGAGEGDDKRNNVGCCLVAPVVDVSEEGSAAAGYEYAGHIAYSDGLPEPFCATPELWETSWPTVESWNAVA